jgi:predicted PurR-regulated permease PerM
VLRPFLLSIIWAAMIVVATWPLMLTVQARLRRRALAVIVMTSTMLLVFVVPLVLAIQALVGNMDAITRWIRSLATSKIPPPPDWLSGVPLVGARIAERWREIAAAGVADLAPRLEPFMRTVNRNSRPSTPTLPNAPPSQLAASCLIAGILYARGERRETA